MPIKKWPIDDDSPTEIARKMCGAYRQSAQQWQEIAGILVDAFQTLDRRLVGYDSVATLAMIDKAIKAVPAAETPVKLDNRFMSWGQTWHCPQPEVYDDDDYVTAVQAGRLIHMSTAAVHKFRQRGKLDAVWNEQLGGRGGFMFRVGDVYQAAASRRKRGEPPPSE